MGLSAQRLGRMRAALGAHVDAGDVPGLVALVARRGRVHAEVLGTAGAGGGPPMRRDALFRIASLTKPITAAAAMTMVEECVLRLDDPVDGLLPELAGRQVLADPGGPLHDTVPAHRPITVRDLLTLRPGIGAVMAPPGATPIQRAMDEAGVAPRPEGQSLEPGEWLGRLGELPLVHQPGERWMYDTGLDVLGVLMSRAAGRPLADLLAERVFEPLGMADTGFHVPEPELDRLLPAYAADPATGALTPAGDRSRWAHPPAFPSAAGGPGLVSTADDLLAFCTMMLNKGRCAAGRVLSRPSVELMTTDQLTPDQKAAAPAFFGGSGGWGLGVGVVTRRDDLPAVPGRFGWDGGTGTSAWTDPAEELIGILLTQRPLTSPAAPPWFSDFWTCAYQAIDD
ncbi:serine hydrolase domain-containing protein [Actinomadura welshii]